MTTPGMPRPSRPCSAPGCVEPTQNPRGRCTTHTRETNQRHATATAYYRTTEWTRLRRACLARDHDQCVVCTGTYRLTGHHIHARKHGGPDVLANLVTLCQPCHSSIEQGDPHVRERLAEHLRISPHHRGTP